MSKTPKLRFKEFSGDWETGIISDYGYFYYGKSAPKWSITTDAKIPCIRYGELYTTHNEIVKEIKTYTNMSKENLKFSKGGEVLVPRVGEKPLEFSKCTYLPFKDIAIGEMISVYNTNQNPLFIVYYFRSKMKYKFARMVEGGNVSNLYYSYLEKIHISIPSKEEQEKIASFFSLIDDKISLQGEKVEALKDYKKGMMQKIFSKELRFKDDDGRDYPEWEEKKLNEILLERKEKNNGNLRVCSVAVRKGVIDQIEHLGRSFAAKDTSNYNLVKYGDIIYTKSPTGDFPYGIIKQSFLNENVVVSPLYGVFKPLNFNLGYILHCYFYYRENTNNYLYSIIQKGAKNTINITNTTFLSKSLILPIDENEQNYLLS